MGSSLFRRAFTIRPKGVYDSLVSNDGRGLKRLHAMVDVADVKIRSSVMTGVD